MMNILKFELRRGLRSFILWSVSISFMLVICVLMFPEMKGEMDELNNLFANMGSFTLAFGLDQLNFGTLIGFYGIECGNILGIGGALYSAYRGIHLLSKEEQEHTAEFLLTHPFTRTYVIFQKLLALIIEILSMNLIIYLLSILSIFGIGEVVPIHEITLLHIGFLIMQLEIGVISFGISSFLRRGSMGVGLGLALVLYFLNIIRNISDNASFLKYITPFAYAEPSDILDSLSLDFTIIILGCSYGIIAIIIGSIHYINKDITS